MVTVEIKLAASAVISIPIPPIVKISHGHFYLNSTYHLPDKSTNTCAVRPFSTANFTASSNILPPCNPGTRSLCPPRFSTPSRYLAGTRESITPQPFNLPLIDDRTQIHDTRRLSLLEFNIQPTHSLVNIGSSSSTAPATTLSTQPPKPRVAPKRAQIQHDHLHPLVFRSLECSACPL